MTDAHSAFGCCSGRRHYRGPHAYVTDKVENAPNEGGGEGKGEKASVDSEDKGAMR
jgi:hypothetical protein